MKEEIGWLKHIWGLVAGSTAPVISSDRETSLDLAGSPSVLGNTYCQTNLFSISQRFLFIIMFTCTFRLPA